MKAWEVAKRELDRIGKAISREDLIIFDHRSLLLLIVVIIAGVAATGLRLHLSSVACWDQVIGGNRTPLLQSVLLGTPKGVRADEWLVQTPMIMSQIANGFPAENANFGSGKSMLLIPLIPVRHYSTLFKPQSWPFFFLDAEFAYSAYWNSRTVGLIVIAFLLIMLLTRSRFWISAAGSLWINFSSYMEWRQLPEYVIFPGIMVLATAYLALTRSRWVILCCAFAAAWATIGLIMLIYPAYQVVIGYLVVFVVAGVLLERRTAPSLTVNLGWKVSAALGAAVVVGLVVVAFYWDVQETVRILAATEYPGGRIRRLNGGDVSLIHQFSGFFDIFFTENRFPHLNVCESVSFIPLYPVILLFAVTRWVRTGRKCWIELALLAYCLLWTIYMSLGLPRFITEATLIGKTYGTRPFIGLTVATVLLCTVSLTSGTLSTRRSRGFFAGAFLFSATAMVGLGTYWSRHEGQFLTRYEIALAALLFGFVLASLVAGRTRSFSLSVLAAAIVAGGTVNPLAQGLSPLYDKDLAREILPLRKADPDGLWLAFGDNYGAAFLKAQGLRVLNGVQYAPDLKKFSVLNPAPDQLPVYNRYAHVEFHVGEDSLARFGNVPGAETSHDRFAVWIDPASPRLAELGVGYLLLPNAAEGSADYVPADRLAAEGWERISELPVNGYWIWKRKGAGTGRQSE